MDMNQAFDLLRQAGGATPARIVLEHISKYGRFFPAPLGVGGTKCRVGEAKLSFLQKLKIRRAARALRRHVPVAKIIGFKWFYGLQFATNKHTLDPRPDSETLVSAVLSEIENKKIRILDLGVGTGCLIGAIAKNNPNVTGIGIDKSRMAIRVAKRNMTALGINNRIKIMHGDFFHLAPHASCLAPYDIIISNPPYIARDDRRVNAAALHDPAMALFADDRGLASYHAIAKNARGLLKSDGKIYLEIGAGQSAAVKKIFREQGWRFAESYKDLGGKIRVLVFKVTSY